jgi:murein DD-endopeptidase / murein LD-carboxypeptidase
MADVVERARALAGTRFRPQGRDPRFGLDCIGLVLIAHDQPVNGTRTDYRLRGDHRAELERGLLGFCRKVSTRRVRGGDVLLLQVLQDQLHLAIHAGESFIHADAKAGRVVETPGSPPWKVLTAFRLRRIAEKGI